jgi:hypothetical protein
VTGNKKTLSANLVSVCMVAIFGFTNIVFIPSSDNAFRHCEPE